MEDVGKEGAGEKVRDTLAMGARSPAAGPEAAGRGLGRQRVCPELKHKG